MSDTPLTKSQREKANEFIARIEEKELKQRRSEMLEEGILIECSGTAKRVGIPVKVGMTRKLWNHLYPFAEDAVKGVTFDEVLWDVFTLFKKESSNPSHKGSNYIEFAILAKTYVKEVINGHVETFKDGKPRTKRLVMMVTIVPDDKGQPSYVFGYKDHDWLS